ncbi:MAG: serine/threonine protein kinase [Gemmatimonadota bacterium]|nr:MAG: serine/threonine protein kinase [Gemmatimonadota bacterium]
MNTGERDTPGPPEDPMASEESAGGGDGGPGGPPGGGPADELESLLKRELAPELEVIRRIARGSMASVYLARELQLKRLVAVKVLAPRLARDQQARLRFEREAQASASLSHPHIVQIHRVGRLSNDLPYIVMQYVKGRTLEQVLQARGPLSIEDACRVLSEVSAAVAAAHQKGIVHRDIRPGNVLYEDESGRALLSDFGIAAILVSGEGGQVPRLTKTGELVGDPGYMSPEQLLGEELTESSDVYALGLLGYELVTGRGPYEAKSKREMITAHIQQSPRRLVDLRGDCDPNVSAVMERCLAKSPGQRPTAADLSQLLRAGSAEVTPFPISGGPAGGRSRLYSRLAERRMPQITAATAAVAWGVLQVADVLADRAIMPEVAFKLVLVAVVTGIPAVLTGAWFHGKKGRQKFALIEYWLFGGLALVWLAVSALILLRWI